MRLCRLVVFLLIAAAAAGCAGVPGPQVAAVPDAAQPGDIDSFMYGRGAPQGAYLAREPEAAVAIPVAAMPPVPAALLPGPAPGGNEPYTLDSGDRLRVVVFGQEGLTSTYIVDATGKIAMPLIGAVSARSLTTSQLAHAITDRLRNGYVREPHVAIEV